MRTQYEQTAFEAVYQLITPHFNEIKLTADKKDCPTTKLNVKYRDCVICRFVFSGENIVEVGFPHNATMYWKTLDTFDISDISQMKQYLTRLIEQKLAIDTGIAERKGKKKP